MKLEWNKKYTTIAVYCCIVILFAVILVNFAIKKDSLDGIVGMISGIFAPIIYGIIIAYLLNPVMNFFEKKVYKNVKKGKSESKLRRAFSLATTYIIFLALVTGFVWLIVDNLSRSLGDFLTKVADYLSKDLNNDIRSLLDFNETLLAKYDSFVENGDILEKLSEYSNDLTKIVNKAGNYAIDIIDLFKNIFLGLFFSIYFLASKELLSKQIKRFMLATFNAKNNGRIKHFFGIVDEKFGQFIRGKILDSTIVMIVVYILTWIFRMPFYPMIALIIGVTDLIPVFGPFLGAIPSAIIILISGGFFKALWFAIIILVVQQIDGNIIAPLILGDKVGIEGVWIMIAVVVMGGFFGIVGMFFGVPIFAVIYTLVGEWIHRRLVHKGIDPVVLPDAPPEEHKLFGILNVPPIRPDEKNEEKNQDEKDENTTENKND